MQLREGIFENIHAAHAAESNTKNNIRGDGTVHQAIIELEKKTHFKEDFALLKSRKIESSQQGRTVGTGKALVQEKGSDIFALQIFKREPVTMTERIDRITERLD